jgi:cytochrome b
VPRQLPGEKLNEQPQERGVRVWDLPTRLFHWIIVLAIAGSWWTAEEDLSERHALIGYFILSLLLFRLVWGFVGSETARFSSFVRGPGAALEHLRHLVMPGKLPRPVGHNALGGYAAIALLLSLAVQAVTGLFLYDDELFWAPLNGRVSEDTAATLKDIHELNFNILLGLIGLHVVAVLFYALVKGLDLVRPMLSGRADLPAGTAAPHMAPLALAFLVAGAAAALVWALITYA